VALPVALPVPVPVTVAGALAGALPGALPVPVTVAVDLGRGPWPGPIRARLAPLSLSICHQVFPPNTLFHRHRPIRPVRLTGFQQARQAFP
jgi:hypothetical protein